MGALGRLRGERTLITVAHRLASVEDGDYVVMVRGGHIADQAVFAELAARNPAMRRRHRRPASR